MVPMMNNFSDHDYNVPTINMMNYAEDENFFALTMNCEDDEDEEFDWRRIVPTMKNYSKDD